MKLRISGWITVEVDEVDREVVIVDPALISIDDFALTQLFSILDSFIRAEYRSKFEWAGTSSEEGPTLNSVTIGHNVIPAKPVGFHMKPSELDETPIWYFNYQLGK